MANNGGPAKGYYSILQFVPDLERSEGANIGVVLFCPEKHFLKVQTATGNDRVRRFFGPEESVELDLDRVNALKAAFEERLAVESGKVQTLEEFRQFIDSRANQMLLTSPRSIKVFDPQTELATLFEALVGGRRRRGERLGPTPPQELTEQLDRLIDERGLSERVKRNVRIESLLLDRTLVFPVAYRNGTLNVVQAASFEAAKDRNIQLACELAVEGADLNDRRDPVKLKVLGSFRPDETESLEHVRAVLNKYNVALHTGNDIESLVREIEETAH
jgi:Protein of unknown function (DUF3037)